MGYLQVWRYKPVSKLFDGRTPTLSENGMLFAHCVWVKASRLTASAKHIDTAELASPQAC